MRATVRLALAALAVFALPVAATAAPAQDAEALAACLIEHSTEADEDALRRLVIAALEEAPEEVFREKFVAFLDAIVRIGVGDCGMALSDFDTDRGKAAASLYGQHVGRKVMEAAFARIAQ